MFSWKSYNTFFKFLSKSRSSRLLIFYKEVKNMKKAETLYEFKHNFYSKLYAAMEKKNKTYKDLSTDLGKNPGYISRIMSGKIEPSFSMIFYIAEALGIEPRDLF